MTPPLFVLQNVELRAAATTILHRVDLALPEVGINVIIGPSGSGKSTLLRLLNGLERATSGTIRFRGTALDTVDVQAHRRRVGMVFQRPTVFDGSAFDNLLVAEPSLSRSGASEALDRVGLDATVLDRLAADLSGGEAQRLCLARTLVTRPDVVLMDEPTSALDADSVHRIEHLARTIVADGVRLIWVSHDREQVRRLADWVTCVEAGRVTETGEARAMGHVHDAAGFWRTGELGETGQAEPGTEGKTQ